MDLISGLNSPQSEAVGYAGGPLLIFAGAGSGKTRTLTHRIAHLIERHQIPPHRILAVTFTNKAAREMRERLEVLIGPESRRIWMGTFHAMCAQMLRMSGDLIGIDRRFVIYDSDDSLRLMKELVKEAEIDVERYAPARMLHRISDAKNNLRGPQELAEAASRPSEKILAKLYQRYQERLRAAHGLDFDDMIGEAVRLLIQSDEALDMWSERFLHVMIDEFQDVNGAQFRWAQLLASKHRNICVVGDDDQSIYGWRGANVKLILDFKSNYPDARVIHLEQNYRSTQNILDAAHSIISRNANRAAKRLWTAEQGGAPVVLHGVANAQEEAQWVVRKIEMLQRGEHVAPGDIAILCRVNAQSRPFEEAFMRARMPLRLVGTQRFYDRKEIKDLIAYLKVLYNPYDGVALNRIINVPARGIGTVTVDKLNAIAQSSNRSLYEVILDEALVQTLGRPVAAKIAPLRQLLLELESELRLSGSVSDLIGRIVDGIGYFEHLRREGASEALDRQANVEEFLSAAHIFDERATAEIEARDETPELLRDLDAGPPDCGLQIADCGLPPEPLRELDAGPPHLDLFLETVALENDVERTEQSGEAVTLMTLHSAKGLEFRVVFIVGMEDGLLPHARALWGETAGGDELEEERRLCYVGLTRAREQVFLTYAAQRTLHGRTSSSTPSLFLDELPSHLVQRGGLAAINSRRYQEIATDWESPAPSGPESRPASRARAELPTEYAIGDRLRHPSFGEGLVVGVPPTGGDGEWVQIAFLDRAIGIKKLVLAYTTLERV